MSARRRARTELSVRLLLPFGTSHFLLLLLNVFHAFSSFTCSPEVGESNDRVPFSQTQNLMNANFSVRYRTPTHEKHPIGEKKISPQKHIPVFERKTNSNRDETIENVALLHPSAVGSTRRNPRRGHPFEGRVSALLTSVSCAGGSKKSKCRRSLMPRDLSMSTTLPRFTRWISGMLLSSSSCSYAQAVYSRKHLPAATRPARPDRCLADAWTGGTTRG